MLYLFILISFESFLPFSNKQEIHNGEFQMTDIWKTGLNYYLICRHDLISLTYILVLIVHHCLHIVEFLAVDGM